MSNPKRHHYVPCMLSKRFANQSGKLFFFDKVRAYHGVQVTTPKNLLVETHLYTTVDSSGNKNVEVERWLAEIEDQVNKVVDKIVNAARQKKTPNLTHAEKEAWCQYYYLQWRRLPEVRDQILSKVFPNELKMQLSEYLGSIEEVNRYIKNEWVKGLLKSNTNVLSVLLEKGLGIIVARNPDCRFVVGSHPMVKFSHPGRADLSDPSVEYWFPLASDVAVSPSGGRADQLVVVDEGVVQTINKSISEQSTVIAGCSRELVSSFASLDTQTSRKG